MPSVIPCLWFDTEAEQAAERYASSPRAVVAVDGFTAPPDRRRRGPLSPEGCNEDGRAASDPVGTADVVLDTTDAARPVVVAWRC